MGLVLQGSAYPRERLTCYDTPLSDTPVETMTTSVANSGHSRTIAEYLSEQIEVMKKNDSGHTVNINDLITINKTILYI